MEEKPYKCYLCEKLFQCSGSLNCHHLLVHT